MQIARGLAALMLAFCLMAGGANAQVRDAGAPKFRAQEDVLAWINAYRDDPKPNQVPEVVKAMSRMGLFRNLDRGGVYIGFFAGVIGANQLEAERLISETFPLRPEDQVVVIRGIADSGLPTWKTLMGRFTERMPARQILIRAYLYGKKKPLAETKLESNPAVLDAWWGYYFATGSYEPILRILPALAWSEETTSLEKLTISGMAQWTLSSNASRDKPLLDFLREEIYRQPKGIREQLARIVQSAETFETQAVRKQAVAKIEALKAKGPQTKTRGWAWWSQAATTTIALGCVVASAAGQAYLGLPCIIGGAASTAATNYLRLNEQ
ncbi:MAG: hypothetical protein AAFQ45_11740 [Pseudomonadota bacterium]